MLQILILVLITILITLFEKYPIKQVNEAYNLTVDVSLRSFSLEV